MAVTHQAGRLGAIGRFDDEWWTPLSGVLAAAAGLFLGVAVSSSRADLTVSVVFIGMCVILALRNPLAGLLLAVLLQPIGGFVFLVVDLGAGIPDITLGRVLTPLLFVLVLAQGAIGRRSLLRVTALDIGMAVAALGVLVMALRGRSVTVGLQWVFDMFLSAYAIYYVIKNIVVARAGVQRVLWAVAAIGAYSGLYAVFTQFTGVTLFLSDGRLWAINYEQYTESLRLIRGLFDAPHIFGTVFGLTIPIQFYLLVKARTPQARALAAVFLLLSIGGLFVTYRRTSYLAVGASLLVLCFFFPRFRRLFLPMLVVIGFVAWLYTDEIRDSAVIRERVGQRTESFNGRTDLWNTALLYAAREPWLGYGNGGFLHRSRLTAIESHYLWLLVDGGLLALAPFGLVFILMIRTGLQLYLTRGAGIFVEPDLAGAFLASLAAYLVNLSTAVINHDFPHVVLFLLAGAILGTHEAMLAQPRLAPTPAPAPATTHG